MRNATLAKLIWVLIYGGLLTLSLGTFIHRQSEWLGRSCVVTGVMAVVVGVVLIAVRARRDKDI